MDRLRDLGGRVGGHTFDELRGSIDIQPPNGGAAATQEEIQKRVKEIRDLITSIENGTADVQRTHRDLMTCTNPTRKAAMEEDLDRLMEGVARAAEESRGKLRVLGTVRVASQTETKILQNQGQALAGDLASAVQKYQDLMAKQKIDQEKRVHRNLKDRLTINNPEGKPPSDEEVAALAQKLMEEGRTDAIFVQSNNALAMAQENYDDIKRIEKSMAALHQIFVDVQNMIKDQGELFTVIEDNVHDATTAVANGRAILAEARDKAKAARRKKIYLCICLVVLILVLSGAFVPIILLIKRKAAAVEERAQEIIHR